MLEPLCVVLHRNIHPVPAWIELRTKRNFSSRTKRNECSALKQRRGAAKGAQALKISMSVVRLEKLVQRLCPEDKSC